MNEIKKRPAGMDWIPAGDVFLMKIIFIADSIFPE